MARSSASAAPVANRRAQTAANASNANQVASASTSAANASSPKMKTRGFARLSWTFVYRPLHDALIEDALSRADAFAGHPSPSLTWSRWVRILRLALPHRRGQRSRRS